MDRKIKKVQGTKYKVQVKKTMVFMGFFLSLVTCSLLLRWWFSGWNGNDPANIVISSGSRLWVLALRPEERRFVEIEIPETMMIYPLGRGPLQARALWQIGELERNSEVVKLIGTDLLEIPIDEVIRVSGWSGVQPPSFRLFLSTVPSLRNIPEVIRLSWYIRSLRDKEITRVDLPTLPMARKIVDPGGSELLEIDRELLSPLVTDWFEILAFRRSGFSIAVISTGNESGAGAKIARQLEHVGFRVISVSHGEKAPGIYVSRSDRKKNPIVLRLSAWFHEPIFVSDFEERSDILVVK